MVTKLTVRIFAAFLLMGFCVLCAAPGRAADEDDMPKEQKVAMIQADMQKAMDGVAAIVNQPAPAYPRALGVPIYPGWLHPGAETPDFNHADVSRTQQLVYSAHEFVSSTTTPTVMFRGTDIVFNPMTKFFVTNRDLPMKRLSEPELQEINRLYRIIGGDEALLNELTGKTAEGAPAAPAKRKLPWIPIIAIVGAAGAVAYLFASKKKTV